MERNCAWSTSNLALNDKVFAVQLAVEMIRKGLSRESKLCLLLFGSEKKGTV